MSHRIFPINEERNWFRIEIICYFHCLNIFEYQIASIEKMSVAVLHFTEVATERIERWISMIYPYKKGKSSWYIPLSSDTIPFIIFTQKKSSA